MAAVEVTISGVLYDKYSRTTRPVVLIGEASLTGLGVGGGPMPPGDDKPPVIWGGPIDPYPGHPLPEPPGRPPGTWGGAGEPFPTPPIAFPPGWVGGVPPLPPNVTPPEPPAPGSPTTPVPPPPGSSGWPVTNIVPPAYMIVYYPGIGPVVVAPPASA